MPASGCLSEAKYSASEFGQVAFEFHEVTCIAKEESCTSIALLLGRQWNCQWNSEQAVSARFLLLLRELQSNRDGSKQDVSYKGQKS